MDSDDSQALFYEAMGRVKPLENSNKAHIEKNRPHRAKTIIRTRQAFDISTMPLTSRRAKTTQNDPWVLIADGVSRDSLKQLAAGRPAVGLGFDLHGMTREQALLLLQQGVEEALREGIRALSIVHGRGLHSEAGKPVLKQAVYHWLREGPLAHIILAVIPQPNSGGGACIVLLRRLHKQ